MSHSDAVERGNSILVVIDRIAQTTPPTIRLALIRGDSFSYTLRVSKAGYDFSGTTARSHLKLKPKDSIPLLVTTPLITFPAVGKLLATLQYDYTQTDWPVKLIYADLELTFPGNIRKTVAFFEIQIKQDVTT